METYRGIFFSHKEKLNYVNCRKIDASRAKILSKLSQFQKNNYHVFSHLHTGPRFYVNMENHTCSDDLKAAKPSHGTKGTKGKGDGEGRVEKPMRWGTETGCEGKRGGVW